MIGTPLVNFNNGFAGCRTDFRFFMRAPEDS